MADLKKAGTLVRAIDPKIGCFVWNDGMIIDVLYRRITLGILLEDAVLAMIPGERTVNVLTSNGTMGSVLSSDLIDL